MGTWNTRGLRGSTLEDLINRTNDSYREKKPVSYTHLDVYKRQDLDTEGLLLITNDGALAHELLSPKKHVDKVYLAYIEGTLPKDAAEQMKNGVILEDGVKTRPAELICLSREDGEQRLGRAPETAFAEAAPVTLTIHEGKFHQDVYKRQAKQRRNTPLVKSVVNR